MFICYVDFWCEIVKWHCNWDVFYTYYVLCLPHSILPVLITWSSLFCLLEKKVHANICCVKFVNLPSNRLPPFITWSLLHVCLLVILLFSCLPTSNHFVGRQKFLLPYVMGSPFLLLYFIIFCSFMRGSACIICEIRVKCFTSPLTSSLSLSLSLSIYIYK